MPWVSYSFLLKKKTLSSVISRLIECNQNIKKSKRLIPIKIWGGSTAGFANSLNFRFVIPNSRGGDCRYGMEWMGQCQRAKFLVLFSNGRQSLPSRRDHKGGTRYLCPRSRAPLSWLIFTLCALRYTRVELKEKKNQKKHGRVGEREMRKGKAQGTKGTSPPPNRCFSFSQILEKNFFPCLLCLADTIKNSSGRAKKEKDEKRREEETSQASSIITSGRLLFSKLPRCTRGRSTRQPITPNTKNPCHSFMTPFENLPR